MGSAIWKLSALATVVGLGMVGVVVQQKGLFGTAKPAANAAANAKPETGTAAPPPKVPKLGGESSASTDPKPAAKPDPTESPFGDEQATTISEGPPDQNSALDGDQTLVDPTAQSSQTEDTQSFEPGQKTQSRTRARGLDFKNQIVGDSTPDSDAGQFEEPAGDGAAVAQDTASGQTLDSSEMEGTVSGDNPTGNLTAEEDPFAKRNAALQAARNQAGGEQDRRGASGQSTEFAAGDPAGEPQTGPVVPPATSRQRGRARLIADAESENAQSTDNVGRDVIDGQSQAAPAGYRAEASAAGKTPTTASKGRPKIGEDEEAFKKSTQAPPGAPGVAAPPAPRTGNIPKRPDGLREEDDPALSRRGAQPPAKSAQLEPKRINEPSAQTDQSMPPSVSKNNRSRPNPFADEDGEPGTTPRPAKSNAPPADRTQTEAQEPTDSSEFENTPPPVGNPKPRPPAKFDEDDNGPLPGTPDAAASLSSQTDVKAPPGPLPATEFPGTAPRTGGRGRVTIEKVAPTTAYIGQPLVYTIKVRNVGNGPAQQVVVEDVLPEGVAMQGSTLQAEMTGRKLAWKMGTMSAGEERKISVKVVPGKAGAIGSAATVKFVADQRNAGADQRYASTDETAVTTPAVDQMTSRTSPRSNPESGSAIQLEMQNPPKIAVGQNFELQFRMTNRSDQPARNLLVVSTLPLGVWDRTYKVQNLEYPVATLAAGESRDMPLELMANRPGPAICRTKVMDSSGRVLFSQEFSFEVEAGSTASAAQGRPSLGVEVVPPSGPVQLGGRAAYEIRLVNRGTAPVRQGIVRLTVPEELRLVDAGPLTYRQEGADLVFDPIPSLEVGQQAVVKAEFVAQAAGDTYLKVQTTASHLKRPLSREEGLTINGN